MIRLTRQASHEVTNLGECAGSLELVMLGKKPASFARLVRLYYLAPDILKGLLGGEQPEGFTRKKLMQVDLLMDWALQRRLLGFPIPPDAQLRARSLLRD